MASRLKQKRLCTPPFCKLPRLQDLRLGWHGLTSHGKLLYHALGAVSITKSHLESKTQTWNHNKPNLFCHISLSLVLSLSHPAVGAAAQSALSTQKFKHGSHCTNTCQEHPRTKTRCQPKEKWTAMPRYAAMTSLSSLEDTSSLGVAASGQSFRLVSCLDQGQHNLCEQTWDFHRKT